MRAVLVVFCALLFAFAITGCGGDDDASSSNSSTPSSAASEGAGGSTSDSGGSEDKRKDSKSNSSGDGTESADKKSSEKKRSSKDDKESSGDKNSTLSQPNGASPVEPLSKSEEKEVIAAHDALIAAINRGDVNYLCTRGYAKQQLEQLAEQGGCQSVTRKRVSSTSDVKSKVRAVNLLKPGVVEVYTTQTRTTNGKSVEGEPVIHFKLENGDWKMFTYTGENI